MSLGWGILTAGRIANAFAAGLKSSRTGMLVRTGARDIERAQAFADRWGGVGSGSYEEVLADPNVQAVYIATPHHLHAQWTIAAAKAGKAILCEKPFTLDSSEAEAALEEVRNANVFFMEAFMYRCSPQTHKLVSLIAQGAVGKVKAIDAEFSYDSEPNRDNFRKEQGVGGGGLMDVGTYCLSFARLVAASCHGGLIEPSRIEYIANLDHGYDGYGVGCMQFPNGILAKIASGIHLSMRNDATVYGEAGSIHIDDPWKCAAGSKMTLQRNGHEPEVFDLSLTTDQLYAHEADAVADFIDRKECPFMSIQDTIGNMRGLDRLRESCGLSFS